MDAPLHAQKARVHAGNETDASSGVTLAEFNY
jgi:hypothetical protein